MSMERARVLFVCLEVPMQHRPDHPRSGVFRAAPERSRIGATKQGKDCAHTSRMRRVAHKQDAQTPSAMRRKCLAARCFPAAGGQKHARRKEGMLAGPGRHRQTTEVWSDMFAAPPGSVRLIKQLSQVEAGPKVKAVVLHEDDLLPVHGKFLIPKIV